MDTHVIAAVILAVVFFQGGFALGWILRTLLPTEKKENIVNQKPKKNHGKSIVVNDVVLLTQEHDAKLLKDIEEKFGEGGVNEW